MRVLQLGRYLDLAAESLVVHAGSEFRRQHLHDHLPAQRHVGRQEDTAHSATGQFALERVSGREGLLKVGGEVGHRLLVRYG